MRSLTVKHLVKYHAHRPNVALRRISTTVQNLRTHVHRTTHQTLVNLVQLRTLLVVLRKTKISNLVSLILNQNIRRLQIAMNNRMLMQIPITTDQLLNNNQRLTLRQLLPLLQDVLQTTLVTQLLKKIYIVRRFLNIIQLHNVLILYRLHNLDLVFQRLVKFLWILLYIRSSDRLHRHQITVSNVSTLKDLTV